MTRECLPWRRDSDLTTLSVNNREYTVGISYAKDESILEIFLDTTKYGSEISMIVGDIAVVISVALQNQVLAKKMAHSVSRSPDGKPSTIVGAALDFILDLEENDDK